MDAAVCPQCGSGPELFARMSLREPLGFRSARPRDFDGSFSWSPRAMAARARADLASLRKQNVGAAVAYSGPGRRFVINDNGGRLFRFKAAAPGAPDWGGYVAVEAVEKQLVPEYAVTGEPFDVALGAVQPTDFLFLGPQHGTIPSEGLRLNFAAGMQPCGAPDLADGRRAAWYSFAFLLRKVAAAKLDIEPLELAAGIFAGLSNGEPAPYAFIADTLENGAGFSTHLGRSEVLPTLLQDVNKYLERMSEPEHATECSASCYRCLRDYGNMAYHALLDWRLASDLLAVLQHGRLAINTPRLDRALEVWTRGFGGKMLPGIVGAARFLHPRLGDHVLIVRHPLETSETGFMTDRLAETIRQVESSAPERVGVIFVDDLTLDRDPGRVFQLCEAAQARFSDSGTDGSADADTIAAPALVHSLAGDHHQLHGSRIYASRRVTMLCRPGPADRCGSHRSP